MSLTLEVSLINGKTVSLQTLKGSWDLVSKVISRL